jgi:hypothetical protein
MDVYTQNGFMRSIIEGDLQRFDLYVECGMDVNYVFDGCGLRPIHVATIHRRQAILESLRRNQAFIADAKDLLGRTADDYRK